MDVDQRFLGVTVPQADELVGVCPRCQRRVPLLGDGKVAEHYQDAGRGRMCPGYGESPK